VRHSPWSDIFGARGRLGVALLNLKARFAERVESWLG
jgi:hypothetical protein